MSPEVTNGLFALGGAVVGTIISAITSWRIAMRSLASKELTVATSSVSRHIRVDKYVIGMVKVMVGGEEVDNVCSFDFRVTNSGNQSIRDIAVQFEFSGQAKVIGGQSPQASYDDLDSGLELDISDKVPLLRVDYLNPGDAISGHLLFAGTPKSVHPIFRKEGVRSRLVRLGDEISLGTVVLAAARSNVILDAYLRLLLPAYRQKRRKNE